MKQAKTIYETNKAGINHLLVRKGYHPSFEGLMKAVKEKGNPFLVHVYNEVTSSFDQADGDSNFWTKFQKFFHSASDVIDKTDKITGAADKLLINPDTANKTTKTDTADTSKSTWTPNLLYWGIAAFVLIALLVVILLIKNKKS